MKTQIPNSRVRPGGQRALRTTRSVARNRRESSAQARSPPGQARRGRFDRVPNEWSLRSAARSASPPTQTTKTPQPGSSRSTKTRSSPRSHDACNTCRLPHRNRGSLARNQHTSVSHRVSYSSYHMNMSRWTKHWFHSVDDAASNSTCRQNQQSMA